MSFRQLPNFKAPSRLKFMKKEFKFYVNDQIIQNFIEQGEQSFSFVVNISSNEIVLFSILEDNEYTDQRIAIHQLLADCQNVVRVIDSIKNIQVDLSALNDNDKARFTKIKDGCTLIIYEYIPFNVLSFSTLEDVSTKNNNGIMIQQIDKQKVLTYFKKIIITVQNIHKRNVYHFDLKPENILANDEQFFIIDFGSAQHIQFPFMDNKTTSVLLPHTSRVAFVVQTTEVFSPCKYDSQDGYVIADKYDVYSLGCILYHLLTNDYLAQPLAPHSPQFDLILTRYGPIVTDLIAGMTNRHILFRYTLDQVLDHPAFQDEEQPQFAGLDEFKLVDQPIIELSEEYHPPGFQNNQSHSQSDNPDSSHKNWVLNTGMHSNNKEHILPDDLFKKLQMTYQMQLVQPGIDLGIKDSFSSVSFDQTFHFKNIYNQLNQYWLKVILDTRKTYSDYIHSKVSSRSRSQIQFQIKMNQNQLCDDCYLEQLKKILLNQAIRININSIMNYFNKQLKTIKSIRERNNLYKNLQDILASDIMQMFRFDRQQDKFFNNNNQQLNSLQLKNLEAAATYQTMTRYNSDDSEDTDDDRVQLQSGENDLLCDISNVKLHEKPKKRIKSASLVSRSLDTLKRSYPPSASISVSDNSVECLSPREARPLEPLEALDIFDFGVPADIEIQYE